MSHGKGFPARRHRVHPVNNSCAMVRRRLGLTAIAWRQERFHIGMVPKEASAGSALARCATHAARGAPPARAPVRRPTTRGVGPWWRRARERRAVGALRRRAHSARMRRRGRRPRRARGCTSPTRPRVAPLPPSVVRTPRPGPQVVGDKAKADLSLRLTDWLLEFITTSGYEAWQLTAPAIEIAAAGVVALNGFRMRPNQRRS